MKDADPWGHGRRSPLCPEELADTHTGTPGPGPGPEHPEPTAPVEPEAVSLNKFNKVLRERRRGISDGAAR
jgi:hypothetical protein